MSSTDATPLTGDERGALLEVAAASLSLGAREGRALTVVPAAYPPALQAPRASFVTLHRGGELRGCMGTLEPTRPLVEDVAVNAFNAGFRDPRFPPVATAELATIDLHIAVLSPAVPLRFASEADLVRRLRPGVDGLILSDGPCRGTFLPAVWESLPEPEAFWRHLKLKAGLPADHWSDTLKVARYTTESFSSTQDPHTPS